MTATTKTLKPACVRRETRRDLSLDQPAILFTPVTQTTQKMALETAQSDTAYDDVFDSYDSTCLGSVRATD